ncbi:MAG: hypothetical protein JSS87_05965 [Acidobacteria bacterium]|nr:hypothetical protein [Acidobacteriota bacterium]
MKNVQEGLRTSCRWFVAAAAVISMVPVAHAAGVESTSAPAPKSIFASSAVTSPTSNLTYGEMNYGVSSSSSSVDATLDERASLGEGFNPNQPPPRRRTYGRPRYSDKWHNSDGSSKIAFEVGAGMAVPAGPMARYYTPSYKFSVGGGLNMNKAFGVLVQFDYDNFGLTGGNIANMYNQYNTLGYAPGTFDGLDANGHIWSFTLNPTISFQGSGRGGAYVVGGIGYARKVTNFTLPTSGTYCDYYYGYCYDYTSNQAFDTYKSGGITISGGLGLTYKLSSFSSQRLFVEARYAWMNTDRNANLFYAHNAERSGYFPIIAGIRW